MSDPILRLEAEGAELSVSDSGTISFRQGTTCWTNRQSLAIVHYYDRQHPRAQQVAVPWSDAVACGTPGTTSFGGRSSLTVTRSGDLSLALTVDMPANGIRIALRLQLLADGRGFTVTIPDGAVSEDDPGLFRVLSIEMLPEFGAAVTGEAGYLTLPNWFGCSCAFDKSYPREVRQTIYSPNDEWEHVCSMPVFGITRAGGTLTGLVTEGDYDARLVCRQHWEADRLNSIHPEIVYRWQQQDERIGGVRQVQYTFTPADSADGEGYVSCGKAYRELLRRRGVQTWAEKCRDRPAARDMAERFFLKIFMAYKDPQPDGKGAYHVGCTFEEARGIIADVLSRGIDRLLVVLVGWGQDGHDGKVPTYLPADDRLGGDAAMRDLVEWCRARGVQLGVHTSHSGTYQCSDEFTFDDVIRHRTGEPWQSIVWSGGQGFRVCPRISLEKYVKRELPRLAALGIHGHHHYDAVGSFELCHAHDHSVTTRCEYFGLIREEFKVAQRVMGSVSTEMPFGPYLDVVDGFFASYAKPFPWHLASPIGRHFYDRSIPLLAVAIHGSHNCCEFTEGGDAWRLQMLDMGTRPQMEVSMRACPPFGIAAYADRKDLMAETYRCFFAAGGLLERIGQADIVARRELAEGVSDTLYDNGVRVLVNRSQTACDGVAPMGFRLQVPEQRPGPADAPGSAALRASALLR
ncbi:MAG: hypothetical protein H0W72_06600 [Planctomycetes bacterium]|nr:hypothetical protein [Planctomycetota bacterium]